MRVFRVSYNIVLTVYLRHVEKFELYQYICTVNVIYRELYRIASTCKKSGLGLLFTFIRIGYCFC
jgi:hypothetical protein